MDAADDGQHLIQRRDPLGRRLVIQLADKLDLHPLKNLEQRLLVGNDRPDTTETVDEGFSGLPKSSSGSIQSD
jgi:hypothetical protein